MKICLTIIILAFIVSIDTTAQRKKDDKFKPVYSGCEVENCYGSRGLSFGDTTKLLARTCGHSVGCSAFRDAGTWKKTNEGFQIETLSSFKAIKDLNGLFYLIKRRDYEFLMHESMISDSTRLLEEIENGFEETDEYKTFFVQIPPKDEQDAMKLRRRFLTPYIVREFTWRYKILVRND